MVGELGGPRLWFWRPARLIFRRRLTRASMILLMLLTPAGLPVRLVGLILLNVLRLLCRPKFVIGPSKCCRGRGKPRLIRRLRWSCRIPLSCCVLKLIKRMFRRNMVLRTRGRMKILFVPVIPSRFMITWRRRMTVIRRSLV